MNKITDVWITVTAYTLKFAYRAPLRVYIKRGITTKCYVATGSSLARLLLLLGDQPRATMPSLRHMTAWYKIDDESTMG